MQIGDVNFDEFDTRIIEMRLLTRMTGTKNGKRELFC